MFENREKEMNSIKKTVTKYINCMIICIGVVFYSGCSSESISLSETKVSSVAENVEHLEETRKMELQKTVKNAVEEAVKETVIEAAPIGSGQILFDEEVLREEQTELLQAYMTRFYESLAQLTLIENSDLYENENADEADKSSILFHIGLRKMIEGTEYSLLSYNYVLSCMDITTEEDGSIIVHAMEDSTQVFAQTPDIESKKYDVYHSFELKETENGWKIASHMMFDALNLVLWSSVERDNIEEQYIQNMPDYLAQIQAGWQMQNEGAEETELPEPTNSYDREAALAYAKAYIVERNPQWTDYSGRGGNCQNYVSQSLLAGDIPMDTTGSAIWKWYGAEVSNNGSNQGRSSSWTGVDQFVQYAENNQGYGLAADTSLSFGSGEAGDILAMGTEGDYRHAVMISEIVQDSNGNTVDYLVYSNTSNLENYPASLYGYPEVQLIKVLGWNS